MIRLIRLQDSIANAGIVTRAQLSLYVQKGKPQYTPEPEEHVFRMDYEAVLWVSNFSGELWQLALILEDSVQEIWPSNCASASVERMDTDPLNTRETDVAFVIKATETYRLTPITVTEVLPDVTCLQLASGLFRVDPVDAPSSAPLPTFRGILNNESVTG